MIYGRVKKRAGKGQWAPPQQPNAPVASVVGSTQTPRSLFDPLAGKSTILSVLTDPYCKLRCVVRRRQDSHRRPLLSRAIATFHSVIGAFWGASSHERKSDAIKRWNRGLKVLGGVYFWDKDVR